VIVGGLLCRNEANRYLRRAVENALHFCGHVVAVDDASTDGTRGVLAEYPGVEIVAQEGTEGYWGHDERPLRKLLWERAAAKAGDDGWIYVFDADHELLDLTAEQFAVLTRSKVVNAWGWVLWDCWDDENLHRTDGYWQAWHTHRPWLVRAKPKPGFVPEWPERQIHVGHFPANYPYIMGLAPGGIRHLGYVKQEDREKKAEKYLALAE
jgi:hypothetical protein